MDKVSPFDISKKAVSWRRLLFVQKGSRQGYLGTHSVVLGVNFCTHTPHCVYVGTLCSCVVPTDSRKGW